MKQFVHIISRLVYMPITMTLLVVAIILSL